ncbi:MAG TPA: hypothetical protein VFD38_04085 [Myxococcaceae bacterium]|nr:hypothetical protein [Myxococcaceae bacterium]
MVESVVGRHARPSRRVVALVAGAAALLLLADVLRWMIAGPVPLLLGKLAPAGADMEAEAGLAALLAVVALVAAGGLRHRLGRPAAVAGLTLAALLANLGPFPTGDVKPAALLPFALVRDGRLTFEGTGLDQPMLPLSAEPLPYFIVRSGERIASKYSPALGVLATPVYLPAALGRFDARSPTVEHLGKLAAAVLTALGVVCIHAAATRLVGRGFAGAATAVYVLGTPVLPVVGQALWLHTGAVLGFSLALLALTGSHDSSRRLGVVAGLGVGLAVACRPVDAILAAGFVVAVWQVRPRALGWMAASASFPVLLLALYQWRVFGSPLATGYGAEAEYGWSAPLLQGIPGLLLSPGRGLFVHAPILLLSVLALVRAGRGCSPRWFLPLGLSVALFVCVMGHWYMWWGGASPGNRMLSDAVPILGVALACGLREAWQRRPFRAPIVVAAALSVATQVSLTFFVDSPAYERMMFLGSEAHPRPWDPGTYPLLARGELLLGSAAPRAP